MRCESVAVLLCSLAASAALAAEPAPVKRAPAPLGVFGADLPAPGAFSLSIGAGLIKADGSRIGTRLVSPEEIATITPWFFNPAFPARVVPLTQHVSTQAASLTYGVNDRLALNATVGLVSKTVDVATYLGAYGLYRLQDSYDGTGGMSDASATLIYQLYKDDTHRLNASLGMTFPTGGINNTFTLLGYTGAYATTRAFYGMQPGSGTFDLLPGVTYVGTAGLWSWGLSWRARLPLGQNRNHYRWGDYHEASGWIGYDPIKGVTTTFRIMGSHSDRISGFDPYIRGRSQSASPILYGGERIEVFGGVTASGALIGYDAWSAALEVGMPVYQNLNGPQLSRAYSANLVVKRKL